MNQADRASSSTRRDREAASRPTADGPSSRTQDRQRGSQTEVAGVMGLVAVVAVPQRRVAGAMDLAVVSQHPGPRPVRAQARSEPPPWCPSRVKVLAGCSPGCRSRRRSLRPERSRGQGALWKAWEALTVSRVCPMVCLSARLSPLSFCVCFTF